MEITITITDTPNSDDPGHVSIAYAFDPPVLDAMQASPACNLAMSLLTTIVDHQAGQFVNKQPALDS